MASSFSFCKADNCFCKSTSGVCTGLGSTSGRDCATSCMVFIRSFLVRLVDPDVGDLVLVFSGDNKYDATPPSRKGVGTDVLATSTKGGDDPIALPSDGSGFLVVEVLVVVVAAAEV